MRAWELSSNPDYFKRDVTMAHRVTRDEEILTCQCPLVARARELLSGLLEGIDAIWCSLSATQEDGLCDACRDVCAPRSSSTRRGGLDGMRFWEDLADREPPD